MLALPGAAGAESARLTAAGSTLGGLTEVATTLPGLFFGAARWGDFDADGDLDVLMAGSGVTAVHRNDGGGGFTDLAAGLPGLSRATAAWGDYDGDGDLDFAVAGSDTAGLGLARVYRNDGGTFTDSGAALTGVRDATAAWGDYDNDGDLDLLLVGNTGSELVSCVYRNDAGAFTDAAAGLLGFSRATADWVDHDGDGDLDILLTGIRGYEGGGAGSSLYRNDGGAFTEDWVGLPANDFGDTDWADYDNDGDPDLLMAGYFSAGVYRNDGGTFTDIGAGLPALTYPRVAWGDWDNDGDADLAICGDLSTTSRISRIYTNDGGGVFTLAVPELAPTSRGSVEWGDYDGDGDLDLLQTGAESFNPTTLATRLYRSDGWPANAPPAAPTGLSATVSGTVLTLQWAAAADGQTPAAALTYNVRVGTTTGGGEISSAMADPATGRRLLPAPGNARHGLTHVVNLPAPGRYWWSVQAIDAGFAGSPFAPERSEAAFTLTDAEAGLPGVHQGAAAWGDFDNDGDLDLALAGTAESGRVAGIHRNDGAGAFAPVAAPLPPVSGAAVEWGDYDADGDLDLLLAGWTGAAPVGAIYRNDGGAFADAGAGIAAVYLSAAAWGDYDTDGDLDLVLTGYTGAENIARVYRNDGGVFVDIEAGLVGVQLGAVAWADIDGDGDLDLALAGATSVSGGTPASRIYRHDAGTFTDIGAGLPGVRTCTVDWADYDADGDPDLLLVGAATPPVARVYRNDGGAFADIGAGLAELSWFPAAAWGDCDNDGDPDIALCGGSGGDRLTRLYLNDGSGVFVVRDPGLPQVDMGVLAWGDHDADGDLDLLLAGAQTDYPYDPITRVYRNDGLPANEPPSAPTGLLALADGNQAALHWETATDDRTPVAALTYNVRIGTSPGADDLCVAMADATNGLRRVPAAGNARQTTSRLATLPGPGQYWWSAQAIDAGFAGSPFAAEGTINVIAYGDIGAGLPGLTAPTVAWGDWDGDGDPDLVLTGADGGSPVTYVYRNDGGGVFTLVSGGKAGAAKAGLPDVAGGALAWGDFDNDGDLDVALCGITAAGRIAGVYRNDGGTVFVDSGAEVDGGIHGAAAWGDLDNDGDLDLYLSGIDPATGHHAGGVYRNDGGGAFTPTAPEVPTVADGSAAWADVDGDGDLDLLLAGQTPDSGYDTRLLRNEGAETFTDVSTGIPGVIYGQAAWGDMDADGDLDILIGGEWDEGGMARVYANDGTGTFTDVAAGLANLAQGSLAWGDYDSDGDPDVLLSGLIEGGAIVTRAYRNDGGGAFTPVDLGFGDGVNGPAAFADHDGDGDLDLVAAGWTGTAFVTRVYGNEGAPANTPPAAPANLRQQQAGGVLTLSWDPAADAQTPAAGLSYNLRIGTTPGGSELMSAMADAGTGRRLLPALGNAQQSASWSVLLPTTWEQLYCGVQAIDAGLAGSPFATELVVYPTGVPDAGPPLSAYVLHAVAPNPFNPGTTVTFDLPAAERVRLAVYDVRGRLVRTLLDEARAAGRHAVEWDGRGEDGRTLASSVYFCRLEVDGHHRTVSMALVR